MDKSGQRDGRRCDVRRTDEVPGGWGGGRASSVGEGMLFFVLVTRNKQKILNTVDFFFSTVLSFAMGKEGKRRNGKRERK